MKSVLLNYVTKCHNDAMDPLHYDFSKSMNVTVDGKPVIEVDKIQTALMTKTESAREQDDDPGIMLQMINEIKN